MTVFFYCAKIQTYYLVFDVDFQAIAADKSDEWFTKKGIPKAAG